MAKNDNLTDFLTDVANAIRAKKGTNTKINPQDFSSEIASIETGGTNMPIIGDGNTYLHIKITDKSAMKTSLYFQQNKSDGVTIDWGDGSATQTVSGTGSKSISHSYSNIGTYRICLKPFNCILRLGWNSSSYCIMGSTSLGNIVLCNMLKGIEIGRNVNDIDPYSFNNCYSLSNVVIPEGVKTIGNSAFRCCYSLSNIVIPDSVLGISGYAFYDCKSLSNIVIPDSVLGIGEYAFCTCYSLSNAVIHGDIKFSGTHSFNACYSLRRIVILGNVESIADYVFQNCKCMSVCDFSKCTSVPTLNGTNVFNSVPSSCKIVVPDALYDTWKSATNWSTHASKIIKASEFNE